MSFNATTSPNRLVRPSTRIAESVMCRMLSHILGIRQVSALSNHRKAGNIGVIAVLLSGMRSHGPSAKKMVAADVWRLMLDCTMMQFGRATGLLHSLGLTPGHMKLLMQLEEGDGRP